MHPEFRKLIRDLDSWLGKVYQTTLRLQNSLMKSKSYKFDSDLRQIISVPIDLVLNKASQLRRDIDGEKESLAILSRTPPGFLSAVLDFIARVIGDPSLQSEKQRYQEVAQQHKR